ncbi:MAG: NAD(P)H-dependent flavin oxidoreductase [Thermodesulfobacteriota bacterium]
MPTRLTKLLGIQHPIIQGAMQWLARAPLAAAVSNAGGLGVINAKSFADAGELRCEIDHLRRLSHRPFAVNLSLLPELAGPDPVDAWLDACIAEKVPVVETAGRSPADFIARLKDAGILVIHKVPAVRFGLSAHRIGVDAVTVVGFECGGHPGLDQVTTMVLAPKAARALAVPVVAGGGVADGHGLAAALALGAEGAVMGTRFLFAEEVALPDPVRRRLMAADERATTLVMQSLKNTARVLDNATARQVQNLEAAGAGIEELRPLISGRRGLAALMAGDHEGGLLSLGQGVGLVDRVMPAAEIIARTMEEARAASARLGWMLEA